MANFLKTIIVRHRKENLKKCSLRGLEDDERLAFFKYPSSILPDLSHYFLLSVDGPPLQPDETRGMMILDGTWRLAEVMENNLPLPQVKRSLPLLKTAYPRRQDQVGGLATVEALFVAYTILGISTKGILDNYYWKNDFIHINDDWFKSKRVT